MVIGCLRLSDVSVICRVVNRRRSSQKIWGGFLYGMYRPAGWLWIDSSGKMETRIAVEGYFGNEFPAICNHCGVMAAYNRKTLNIFEKFFRSFGKTTAYSKIFKIMFQRLLSRHRSTCCFKFRQIWLTWNRWNFAWISSCRYRTDRAQNLPGPAPDYVLRVVHPNQFTFGVVIAERVNTAKKRRK